MYINQDFSAQRGKHINVSFPPCSLFSIATSTYSFNPEVACMLTNA